MKKDSHPDGLSEADLEQFIDRELRRLPERTAPSAVTAGVLARLRQRAALPWWRRPLWQWPLPARASALGLLVLLSLGIMAVGSGLLPLWEMDWATLAGWRPAWLDLSEPAPSAWGTPGILSLPSPLRTWMWGVGSALALSFFLLVGVGALMIRLIGRTPATFNPVRS